MEKTSRVRIYIKDCRTIQDLTAYQTILDKAKELQANIAVITPVHEESGSTFNYAPMIVEIVDLPERISSFLSTIETMFEYSFVTSNEQVVLN